MHSINLDTKYLTTYLCLYCDKEILMRDPNSDLDEHEKAAADQFIQDKERVMKGILTSKPSNKTYEPDKHLICEDCFKNILAAEEKAIFAQEKENALRNLQFTALENRLQEPPKMATIPENIENAKQEHQRKLDLFKQEEDKLISKLKHLTESHLKYEEEEAKYWEELTNFDKKLQNLLEQRTHFERAIVVHSKDLEKLEKSNVLNDVFKISTEHEVATLNDMKIGKPFNTSETLLNTIIRIKLKPMGGISEIIRIEGGREERYEAFGRPRDEERFNKVLSMLLSLCKQVYDDLNTKLTKMIPGVVLDLPHRILGDLIDDIEFKFSSNKLDKWTEIMKSFLTNCKYLIYLVTLYEKNYLINAY